MRNLLFTLILITAIGELTAQENGNKLINIKQRMLRPKFRADDIKQVVDSTSTLHLMIAGNVYQTEKHANYCYDNATGKYSFRQELKYIQPILSLGDVAIANLKTSFANDAQNMFSSPDEFSLALKYSGINVLAAANAHTAQIDKNALKRTRDLLYSYDMLHTGAFTDGMQRNGNFPLIINKKGFRIALLNYANLGVRPGISKDFIINEIDKTYIERDMRVARINKPDFIIVYFDWGTNNQDIPSAYQVDLAQYCFNQGANMVVGTLPNTPLRLDYMPYMQNGQWKEGIVAYSLGSLIASNDEVRNRNGYVIDMELKKNNYTGQTNLGDWGVIPVYTYYDTITNPGKTKVLSVPCSAVETGDILVQLPYIEKRRVINGAYEVRKLLGSTSDEIQYNLTELTANNVMETIDLTKSALNNRYNQKKESDVAPSPVPALPVATIGSNNPPSLASIFGEGKPADPKSVPVVNTEIAKKTALEYEAEKAERLFIEQAKTAPAIAQANEQNAASVAAEKAKAIEAAAKSNAVANNTGPSEAAKIRNATEMIEEEARKKQEPNLAGTADASKKSQSSTVTSDDARKKKESAASVADEVRKKKTTSTLKDDERKEKTEVLVFDDTKLKPTLNTQTFEKTENLNVTSNAANSISNASKVELPINLNRAVEKTVSLNVDTSYRIQIYALQKFIPLDTNYYTHLKGYEVIEEDGYFKYLLGRYKRKEDCEKIWREQILPRYKSSFIVQYIDGKRKFD